MRGKPKIVYRARYCWVPREPERTSGDYAFFLCDTTEYLFGRDAPANKKDKRPDKKLQNRRKLFREKIQTCLDETGDESITALLDLLDKVNDDSFMLELNQECEPSDLITFVYAPDVDLLIGDRPKIRDFWARRRATEILQQPVIRCLVTGEQDHAVMKHPMLKRVPGGTTSGVALVSFNAKAFESYGLSGNENAPVSQLAAERCATTMNRLLNPEAPDPRNPDAKLNRRNYRLSADTVVCYWAVKDEAQDFCDQFAPILEANPDEVRRLYHSIWKGEMPPGLDASAFYALTLTGTQGRAIVRDWFQSTVNEVARQIAR
jgi:CRISPR-associated protein Csd1